MDKPTSSPVLIRGGIVPTRDASHPLDVLVRPPGIEGVAAGLDAPAGARVLDAAGLLVLPGFIDAHVHGELELLADPVHEPALRQGVTGYVVGQDGTSITPGGPETRRAMRAYFAGVNGDPPGVSSPATVRELLARYDGASTAHAAFLVPNGNLRLEVVGGARRPASRAELDAMGGMLDEGLAEGAAGLSSGLDYAPSGFADTGELAALCERVARRDKVYVTHMRGYGDRAAEGMAEVREIARRTGVRVHVSHFSGRAGQVLPHVDAALAEGIDLTFDTYPYTAASSVLSMYALPSDLQEGGHHAMLGRLEDPSVAARVKVAPYVRISCAPHPDWKWTEGLTLAAASARAGLAVPELVVTLLRATRLAAGVVYPRDTFSLDDVRAVAAHPAHMAGSDGIFQGGAPHPRAWGSFATLVRDKLDGRLAWSWPELVDHLTGRAARRFGFAGRGAIEPGARADLVVLDPARVFPRATDADPRRPAEGAVAVLLDGVPALWDGRPTGARPGTGIRA